MTIVYLLPIVLLVAVWLHELCHYAVARLVGADVQSVDLWNLHVDFRAQDSARSAAVIHSPFIVGLSLLPALFWLISAGLVGVLAVVGWIGFTLTGGRKEIGIIPRIQSK